MDKGFTFIEVLVVVVILALLATLVVPRVISRVDQAKVAKAKADIASLKTALRLYKLDNGTYPTTQQGLEALVKEPAGGGNVPLHWREEGYLESSTVPRDPWGNMYQYFSPGVYSKDFDIICLGEDGLEGGDGYARDIYSWDLEGSP